MKTNLLPLAFFATLGAGAQTQVSGVLVDSINRSGEPYATVRLLSPKGTTLSSFLTDENGHFSKTLNAKGPHVLTFSAVGRKTVVRPVDLGASALHLDTLLISSSETLLGAATVVAQKPLVKMETDKISYDTENDADTKNFTLLDMLRKVPLVIVDGQDNITVNGSGNFLVYVDGKPNPMFQSNPSQVLKSIPATYVKKIEVLTNPGARFDAEGVGGVLNLITQASSDGSKPSMDGYSGNIGGRFSHKNGLQTDGFLSWQRKKLTLTLNAIHNATFVKGITVDMNRLQTLSPTTVATTAFKLQQNQRQYYSSASVSAAYQLNKADLISVSAGLSRWAERTVGGANNSFSSGVGTPLTYLSWKGNRATDWNGYLSADYQHSSKSVEGRLLTLSYRLNFLPEEKLEETQFEEKATSSAFDLRNRYYDGDNNTTEHIAQLDYTTPFAKVHKLSVGTKFTARNNHAQTEHFLHDGTSGYVYNPAGSSDYKEYSKIGALYAEYESTIKTFNFKAGLRYEHTWLEEKFLLGTSKDFKVNYGNLVPSATISWTPRQGQNLGLSYSQRISRPGLHYMNPSVNESSPFDRSFGNVNLDAERHNKVALVYNFFSPKVYLNLQLSHNFTNNAISEYSYMDGAVQTTTYGNVSRERTENLSLFVNVNATKTTRIYTNLSGTYADLRSETLGFRNHGWSGRVMVGFQQELPWKVKLSANLFGNSPSYNLQSRQSSFIGTFASINRSFFKDKFDVGAFIFTPLTDGIRQNTNSWGKDFTQSLRVRVPIRVIGLSLRYNFGNRQIKAPTIQRTIENNDVKTQEKSSGIPGGIM